MGLCTTPVKINVLLLPYAFTEAITSGHKDGREPRGLERDLNRKNRILKLNETFESISFYPCENPRRQTDCRNHTR